MGYYDPETYQYIPDETDYAQAGSDPSDGLYYDDWGVSPGYALPLPGELQIDESGITYDQNGVGYDQNGAVVSTPGGSNQLFKGWSDVLSKLGTRMTSPGGVLGMLQGLAALQARKDQSSLNQQRQTAARSPYYSMGLGTPTGSFLPGRGKTLDQVRMAKGGALSSLAGEPVEMTPGAMDDYNISMAIQGYLNGGTPGQADKIPAMLSDGEYVMDADSVSSLGDGNNAAGAAALDKMRENIRRHKRSAPAHKVPPKAKAPEQYLKGAK